MTITMTAPTSGDIGPGTALSFQFTGFTAQPGDIVSVVIQDTTPAGIVGGEAVLQMSVPPTTFTVQGYSFVSNTMIPLNPSTAIQEGAACQVFAEWIRPSPFTIIDSATFTGFTWANSDLYNAIAWGISSISGSSALAAQVNEIHEVVTNGQFNQTLVPALVSQAVAESPISGGTVVNLTNPTGVFAANALTWNTVSAARDVTTQVGVIDSSSRRVIQIVVFYTLPLVGGYAGKTFESNELSGTCWFDTPVPTSVSVYVWPGFTVDMSWIGL